MTEIDHQVLEHPARHRDTQSRVPDDQGSHIRLWRRLLGLGALGLELGLLRACELAHLTVGLGLGKLARLREIVEQLLVAAPRRDERIELGMLARQFHELGAFVDDLGGAE